MAFTANEQIVVDLFIASYGRAPTQSGLDFFSGALTDGTMTEAQIRDFMMDTTNNPEAATRYPDSGTTEAKIETVFNNVLGRGTASAEGLAYWVNKVDNEDGYTMADLMDDVLKEAKNNATDAKTLENKSSVAEYFLNTIPADSQAGAQPSLDSVTDEASVTAAKASVDEVAPQTFDLTVDKDEFTGGKGNDTFNGVVSSLSSENTFGTSDVLDGAEGADTLALDMKGNFTGLGSAGSIKNIETIQATNETTLDRSFNAQNITGVTKYDLDSAKSISLSKLAAADVEVAAKGFQSNFSVAFDSDLDLSGTADAMTFTLDGLGKAAVKDSLGVTTKAAIESQLTMEDIEDITINTTGDASFIDLSKTDAKTYTIAGSADLSVADVKNGLTTVDASSLTGDLTIDTTSVTTAASIKTIQGGSGANTISADAVDLVANATIAGGSGSDDKLTLSGGAKTTQLTMSGIETVAFANTGAITFSGTNIDGLSNIELLEAATAGFTAVNLGGTDITFTSKGDTNQNVSMDNSGKATVNFEAATAKTADTNKKATGAALVNNEKATGNVTLGNAASVEINVGEYTEYNTGTIDATKATDVTLNVASSKNAATAPAEQSAFNGILDIAKATTLTIDANGTVATANGSDVLKVQNLTIDADQLVDMATNGAQHFAAAANLVLSGSTTKSAIKLDNVGIAATGDAVDYALSIQATGLKTGLDIADVKTQQGLTIDVTGVTGNATFVDVEGANVTVNADTIGGTLTTTSITAAATNTGTAEINVKNAGADIVTGNITGFKTINVDASGTLGNVDIGTVTAADTATINLSDVLGTVEVDTITAKSAVSVTTGLQAMTKASAAGTPAITLIDTATDSVVTLNGSTGDDEFTVNGGTAQESITLKGDLASGTNVVNVTLKDSSANQTVDLSAYSNTSSYTSTVTNITAETNSTVTVKGTAGTNDAVTLATAHTEDITLTDVEQVNITDDTAVNASAISGQTINVTSDTAKVVTLNGTDSDDTINISSVTTVDAGDATYDDAVTFTVVGGEGDDEITLGATAAGGAGVVETVKFADTADNNGEDTITGAVADEDIFNFDAFVNVDGVADVDASNNTGTAVLQAGVATNATYNIADKVVFMDKDDFAATSDIIATVKDSATTNEMVLATDEKAVIIYGDIDGNAGGDLAVYYMTGAAGDDTLELVGTITVDDIDAMTAGQFIVA